MIILLKSVAALGGIVFLLSVVLVIANRLLAVQEDPRIDQLEDMLPHTNCGACGYPGCRAFAEALAGGKALPALCTVSSDQGRQQIADFLGVEVGQQIKRVARLACAGGTNVARNRAAYQGLESCRAAAAVAGGGKGCFWGCLGLGDCEVVCDFDAIVMNRFSLPVVLEEKCTACGDCVEICPKDLFSIHPADHRLWVACKNLEFGDDILEECQVACTACSRCAQDAEGGLISMVDNLPQIDYSRQHQTQKPIQRCPTGAIVWLKEDGAVVKGAGSRKVIGKNKLDPLST